MKSKFIYLLVGALIVLGVSATLLNNRRGSSVDFDKVGDSVSSTQNKVSPFNFDPAARTYKSPVITGLDRVKRVFTLSLPEGWSIEKEHTEDGLYVVFVKDDSSIVVSEYYESGRCVFPEYESRGEFGYAELDHHKLISTNFGDYRIGKYNDYYNSTAEFRLCENVGAGDAYTDSPWYSGTKIGLVVYSVEAKSQGGYSSESVEDIENIIKSIDVVEIDS